MANDDNGSSEQGLSSQNCSTTDRMPTRDHELDALFAEGEKLFRDVFREPSNDREVQEAHHRRDDPFASFKRYVDSNMTALAHQLTQLPTNIARLRTELQREADRCHEEEQSISQRWTGSWVSPDQVQLDLHRCTVEEKAAARGLTQMMFEEAARKNAKVPMAKIVALFKDDNDAATPGELDYFANPMLSFGGACYYKSEGQDNLPSTATVGWRWPAAAPRWLGVEWFRRSPYSPIRLEMGMDEVNWRAAFEDLLCAALDKPMTSREQWGGRGPRTALSTYRCPGSDWMLSLQCRGILPPLLSRTFNSAQAQQLRKPSDILALLQRPRGHGPWFSEHAVNAAEPYVQDFSEMMAEIATKPVSEEAGYTREDQTSPANELEFYESIMANSRQGDDHNDRNDDIFKAYKREAAQQIEQSDEHNRLKAVNNAFADSRADMTESPCPIDASGASVTKRAPPRATAIAQLPTPADEPELVSSHTSTETTRRPDGTVTTRVVLQQRFRDGREVVSENVHTFREATSEETLGPRQSGTTPSPTPESQKKPGWFWL